jgi:hypothetical protein
MIEMKKIVSLILVICIAFSVLTAFAADTEIIINGEKAVIAEGMGKITQKNDRIFVPIRFLMEHFGFVVSWNDDDQTVIGCHENGESFVAQVGNTTLFYFEKDGRQKSLKPMDVAPYLNEKEDRTYIPIRFIAQAIGYKVGWDGATETVTLTK